MKWHILFLAMHNGQEGKEYKINEFWKSIGSQMLIAHNRELPEATYFIFDLVKSSLADIKTFIKWKGFVASFGEYPVHIVWFWAVPDERFWGHGS